MTFAWQLFTLLGAFSILALLVHLVYHKPLAGLWLTSVPLLMMWEFPNSILLFSAFGNNIFLLDAIAATLGAAGALRLLASKSLKIPTSWVLLASAVLISAISGLVLIGGSAPLVDVRPHIWLIALFPWAFSIRWTNTQRSGFRTWATVTTLGLVTVAGIHAALYGIGDASSFINDDTGEQVGRVLVSAQAFALALLTVYLIRHASRRLGWLVILAAILALIASQQRTVWVAFLIMLAILIVLSRKRASSVFGWSLASIIFIFTLWVSGAATQTLNSTSVNDIGTYLGRVYSWSQLIEQAVESGLGTILFGSPYGSGYVRVEQNGQIAYFSPHNWYLALFLRIGAVGLLLYLIGFVEIVRRALRSPDYVFGLAVLGGLLVYGWTYGLPFFAAAFLAFVSAAAVRKEQSPQTPPTIIEVSYPRPSRRT